MSLQISCTMCSLCAALLLISWILPLSSTMACLAWSRSAFARAPPVLCDRTAARISSSTFRTLSRRRSMSGSTCAGSPRRGRADLMKSTALKSGEEKASRGGGVDADPAAGPGEAAGVADPSSISRATRSEEGRGAGGNSSNSFGVPMPTPRREVTDEERCDCFDV